MCARLSSHAIGVWLRTAAPTLMSFIVSLREAWASRGDKSRHASPAQRRGGTAAEEGVRATVVGGSASPVLPEMLDQHVRDALDLEEVALERDRARVRVGDDDLAEQPGAA